jgi:hypothetical protein
MRVNSKLRRVVAVILFSLLMAWVLGLGGLLGGSYVWSHYGPAAKDPHETDAYLCGLVVGALMAVGGVVAILWTFWPRTSQKSSPPSHNVNGPLA